MALPVSPARLDFLTDIREVMLKHNVTGVCFVYAIAGRGYVTALGLNDEEKLKFSSLGELVGEIVLDRFRF